MAFNCCSSPPLDICIKQCLFAIAQDCTHFRAIEYGTVDWQHCRNGENFLTTLVPVQNRMTICKSHSTVSRYPVTINVLYKFANYTAWGKWRLKKKNYNPAPKLVAYALTLSFSHVSHQSGHNSLSPITVDMVKGGLQCCDHLGPAPWGYICAMVRSVGS